MRHLKRPKYNRITDWNPNYQNQENGFFSTHATVPHIKIPTIGRDDVLHNAVIPNAGRRRFKIVPVVF